MDNCQKSQLIGIIVAVCGLIVMAGWIFGIPVLTSILPFWVTMKFVTALSFLLCGVLLYFINEQLRGEADLSAIIIPVCAFLVLLLMSSLLLSVFVGVRTGIESLFVREDYGAVRTVYPGLPSLMTMVSFILVAIAGFLVSSDLEGLRQKLSWIGGAVSVIGCISVLGYSWGVPVLYYSVAGLSSAMAFHTSLLFVLLGYGLVLAGGCYELGRMRAVRRR